MITTVIFTSVSMVMTLMHRPHVQPFQLAGAGIEFARFGPLKLDSPRPRVFIGKS